MNWSFEKDDIQNVDFCRRTKKSSAYGCKENQITLVHIRHNIWKDNVWFNQNFENRRFPIQGLNCIQQFRKERLSNQLRLYVLHGHYARTTFTEQSRKVKHRCSSIPPRLYHTHDDGICRKAARTRVKKAPGVKRAHRANTLQKLPVPTFTWLVVKLVCGKSWKNVICPVRLF